jgi:hypothetical protein
MVKKNEVKRSYFLNLFSGNAEKTVNSAGTKNIQFRWNIRDLQLGSVAEIGLVQLVQKHEKWIEGQKYLWAKIYGGIAVGSAIIGYIFKVLL